MRPRTATIQVWKSNTDDIWYVEIGDPKQSVPTIIRKHRILDNALSKAVWQWADKEGLGD